MISFFLCWAPFHAQRLGYVYFKESMVFRTINEYLMYISGILYYVSSTINPILYNLMSIKYRQAFRKTLCGMEVNHGFGGGGGGGGTLNNTKAMRPRLNTWDSAAEVNHLPQEPYTYFQSLDKCIVLSLTFMSDNKSKVWHYFCLPHQQ